MIECETIYCNHLEGIQQHIPLVALNYQLRGQRNMQHTEEQCKVSQRKDDEYVCN